MKLLRFVSLELVPNFYLPNKIKGVWIGSGLANSNFRTYHITTSLNYADNIWYCFMISPITIRREINAQIKHQIRKQIELSQ